MANDEAIRWLTDLARTAIKDDMYATYPRTLKWYGWSARRHMKFLVRCLSEL